MAELGEVLRTWRDRLQPADVGLPSGAGRRAAGLRREELALLAGLSVEYLVRLEQGRARNPSPSLLASLARALRLSDDERDYLYRVAGVAVPSRGHVPQHVVPGVQRLVDRLGDVPLGVFTAAWDLVLWNSLWAAISGDPVPASGLDRNIAWRWFAYGRGVMDFDDSHAEDFSDDLAADLREAHGRYPLDPGLRDLIERLHEVSDDFARRWQQGHVARHRSSRKTATSTPVGPITVDCDVLTVPGSDLRVVVYTATPGSSDASKLELLAVPAVSAKLR